VGAADVIGADPRLHARREFPLEQRDVGHQHQQRVQHDERGDRVRERGRQRHPSGPPRRTRDRPSP
jgi:hypothetical protein